jgi:uncharacterized protein YbjT (DUF2867 family)
MSRIAVIGGHGKVALHLSRILTERGHQVSALIRNPTHRDDVEATGAEAVVADVEALETRQLTEVLQGHDAVVWSAGAGGGSPERTYAVDRDAAIEAMAAAEEAGIKRFVMVSYFGASPDHGVPADDPFFAYAEAKAAADEHLRSTDLDWTVLGPSSLTDAPATGKIETGITTGKSEVSREDVALVVAAALEEPTTVRRTIEFNNGETPIGDALTG